MVKISLNREVSFDVTRTNFFTRLSGLMFRTSKTKNLFFSFSRDVFYPIHSFFVFFSFYAIWLDKDLNVVDIKIVKPFSLSVLPKRKFRYIIELPFNSKNIKKMDLFVGKRKI